jgi:hypothetical protein
MSLVSKSASAWAGELVKWLAIISTICAAMTWFTDVRIRASVQPYTPLERTERLEARVASEESDRKDDIARVEAKVILEDQRLRDTLTATQSWVSSNHVETLHALQLIQLQLSNMSNWLHTVKITSGKDQVGGYAF